MIGSFSNRSTPVVTNLIIINILFWLASIALQKSFGVSIEQYLGLHFFQAPDFRLHQLISYMFLHDYANFSLSHIFFNMFALYMFGRVLEQVWGPKRFILYYIVTGVGAALVQQSVQYFELRPMVAEFSRFLQDFPSEGISLQDGTIISTRDQLVAMKATLLNQFVTIGASGAVFGLLLAFGMLFPNTEILLLIPPMPVKAKYFVIFYGIAELFMGIGGFQGNVAHFAHLGGMLFGIFLILYWKKHSKHFY